MKNWLQYCHWYFSTALSPDASIDAFIDAPIISRNWRIDRTDPVLFGLLWKVYDLVDRCRFQVANT